MVNRDGVRNVVKKDGRTSVLNILKDSKRSAPIDAEPSKVRSGEHGKSTRVKNKPWGLPEVYVDHIISQGQYRGDSLKKQLKLLVMEGGSISSRAVDGVDRGVLYRALKRFESEHEFIQTGAKLAKGH
jgi:hypothetical protein